MDVESVKQILVAELPDARVTVDGEDCNFSVTVISEQFQGEMPVARQKKVLGLFKAQLATGELHALSVNALTPEEGAQA